MRTVFENDPPSTTNKQTQAERHPKMRTVFENEPLDAQRKCGPFSKTSSRTLNENADQIAVHPCWLQVLFLLPLYCTHVFDPGIKFGRKRTSDTQVWEKKNK